MAYCIFITELIRELHECLRPCFPHTCKETVIQIEPRKLVLRNKDQVRQNGKGETFLARFSEITLSYQSSNLSFLGLYHKSLGYMCEKTIKVHRPRLKKTLL